MADLLIRWHVALWHLEGLKGSSRRVLAFAIYRVTSVKKPWEKLIIVES
jgi:hypothetical protein